MNEQWCPRFGLKQTQPDMHSIWKYEINDFNSVGFWLSLQEIYFKMMDDNGKQLDEVGSETTASTKIEHFGAWERIFGMFALSVVAICMEVYRNSINDPSPLVSTKVT